jgi:hypothetical protein
MWHLAPKQRREKREKYRRNRRAWRGNSNYKISQTID